jgi:hypothetical protein
MLGTINIYFMLLYFLLYTMHNALKVLIFMTVMPLVLIIILFSIIMSFPAKIVNTNEIVSQPVDLPPFEDPQSTTEPFYYGKPQW